MFNLLKIDAMETKISKKEMQKIEKICEKALGISVENLFTALENNMTIYLDSDLFYYVLEIIDKKIKSPDYYDNKIKYNYVKEYIIDEYNFDLNTYFEIKCIYEDGDVKILKKGNYFECMNYFDKNYPLDEIEDIFGTDKIQIKIIDNKNNFKEILYEN